VIINQPTYEKSMVSELLSVNQQQSSPLYMIRFLELYVVILRSLINKNHNH